MGGKGGNVVSSSIKGSATTRGGGAGAKGNTSSGSGGSGGGGSICAISSIQNKQRVIDNILTAGAKDAYAVSVTSGKQFIVS